MNKRSPIRGARSREAVHGAELAGLRRDSGAFEVLYRGHAYGLLILLTRRVLDAEAAMDLMAETFAQASLRRHRFRGSTAEDAAEWLYGIAFDQVAGYARRGRVQCTALRKLGLERPAADDQELARIVELAALVDVRQGLRARLEGLSPEQRVAVELRVVDDLAYPDVARRLDITEDAARARISRGLHALTAPLDRVAPAGGEGDSMTGCGNGLLGVVGQFGEDLRRAIARRPERKRRLSPRSLGRP